jgi:hypothetical protein
VLALAVVFLFQGKGRAGIIGLVLVALGVFYVFSCAPWKSPQTPYWRLMIRPYAMFLTAIVWTVWAFGGWRATGLSWWSLFLLLPILMPLFTIGRRSWNDSPPQAR